jgi:hypothetical protein
LHGYSTGYVRSRSTGSLDDADRARRLRNLLNEHDGVFDDD